MTSLNSPKDTRFDTLRCPQCGEPLSDVTSLTGWQLGETRIAESLDVGRCVHCSRVYEYRAATDSYKAQTFQPLCRRCDNPLKFDPPASTPARHVYTCVQHRSERWTHDPAADVWTDFSLVARYPRPIDLRPHH